MHTALGIQNIAIIEIESLNINSCILATSQGKGEKHTRQQPLERLNLEHCYFSSTEYVFGILQWIHSLLWVVWTFGEYSFENKRQFPLKHTLHCTKLFTKVSSSNTFRRYEVYYMRDTLLSYLLQKYRINFNLHQLMTRFKKFYVNTQSSAYGISKIKNNGILIFAVKCLELEIMELS